MRVLWEKGEATVVDAREALAPERPLALTTVATTLKRLEKRGLVTHRRDGRQFVYRAAREEEEVRRSMVGEFMERLFEGDAAALVHHLLREQDVDPDDVERIRALLEEREGEGNGNGGNAS